MQNIFGQLYRGLQRNATEQMRTCVSSYLYDQLHRDTNLVEKIPITMSRTPMQFGFRRFRRTGNINKEKLSKVLPNSSKSNN